MGDFNFEHAADVWGGMRNRILSIGIQAHLPLCHHPELNQHDFTSKLCPSVCHSVSSSLNQVFVFLPPTSHPFYEKNVNFWSVNHYD